MFELIKSAIYISRGHFVSGGWVVWYADVFGAQFDFTDSTFATNVWMLVRTPSKLILISHVPFLCYHITMWPGEQFFPTWLEDDEIKPLARDRKWVRSRYSMVQLQRGVLDMMYSLYNVKMCSYVQWFYIVTAECCKVQLVVYDCFF